MVVNMHLRKIDDPLTIAETMTALCHIRRMNRLPLSFLVASLAAAGCAATTGQGSEASDDSDLEATTSTIKPVAPRSYTNAPGWSSSCEDAPVTQADLQSMLGTNDARVLGRFEVATRDFCSPWVNGASSCGPSGETIAAYEGKKTFAFGLDPSKNGRIASWQFRSPLLVHDAGDVVARRAGDRVIVQLVGDLSSTEIATAQAIDGQLSGNEKLVGRLLSSDLVRDTVQGGVLRMAAASDAVRLDPARIDAETLRYTSPPAPVFNLARLETAYGAVRWARGPMWALSGPITRSCMRLTDGMKPTGLVVTAAFDAR